MADPSETTQVAHGGGGDPAELLGAVRSLASSVGDLQAEVHALRQDARGLPSENGERLGWDEGQPVVRESPSWVRSVDAPRARGLAVPWLLVEILFLVAVAVLAAVAGLDAPVIAGVMIVAWILVAIAEWAMSRSAARKREFAYGPTVVQEVEPDDPTWFRANGDDTMLDASSGERSPARLPPAATD